MTWPAPSVAGACVLRRLGRGPDVLFLHGLLGAGTQFEPAAAQLAPDYCCWVLELPGISLSPRLRSATLAELVAWLAHTADACALTSFILIGSSWGGALALAFAAAQPHRVRRLVAVAPAHPFWQASLAQRLLLFPPLTRVAARVGAGLGRSRHRDLLAAMYGNPGRMPPSSLDGYRERLCRPGLGAAVAGYARHWRQDQAGLRAALSQVTMPVLLLWGSRDRVVPAATAPALRSALPRAQLTLLPGLGHLPFEEDPDAFVAAVRPFLRG
ncbi:MAG: alpha/beta fold hydrolase [Terriglobales bacterium]